MQHDFILLDRSGSMSSIWLEAINSVNEYVKKLAEEKVDTGVTAAVFDTNAVGELDFAVIRERIIPSTWAPVTDRDAEPRGMTPLNDAIGKIVALAEAGNYDKLALIIITDGNENASRELKADQAKVLLDRCRSKGWQVIFLGANFNNAQQSRSYGNAAAQTVGSILPEKLGATMAVAGLARSAYGSGAKMDMAFTDEDKAKLTGADPGPGTGG